MSQYLRVLVTVQLKSLDRSYVNEIQDEIIQGIRLAALELPEVEEVKIAATFLSKVMSRPASKQVPK